VATWRSIQNCRGLHCMVGRSQFQASKVGVRFTDAGKIMVKMTKYSASNFDPLSNNGVLLWITRREKLIIFLINLLIYTKNSLFLVFWIVWILLKYLWFCTKTLYKLYEIMMICRLINLCLFKFYCLNLFVFI